MARLEAGATGSQVTSRSGIDEFPHVHLKIGGPEDLSSVSGAGGTSDVFGSSPSSTPTYGSPEDVQKAIEELRQALPGKNSVQTNPNTLEVHGSSENSYHPSSPHSIVVMAHSTEDVVKVVNISRKYRVPIIAYGGATSLEGQFSGVSIHLSLFARG